MRIHGFHHLYQHRLQLSTRPFAARGAKIDRCPYCRVDKKTCLCAYQPNITTDVAVLLILSENEVFKPSNTGRLIADTVKETFVYQWNRTQPDPSMLALLNDPAYYPVLVFPAEHEEDQARTIKPNSVVQSGKKPLLIFLDGSWREAKKIFRKSSYLADLPMISVHPTVLSEYMMRKSDNEQHLATAEVACLVLDAVGEHWGAQVLHAWFEAFKESYMRGKSRSAYSSARPALQRYRDTLSQHGITSQESNK
ncbi:tRNA-uridine aminocarboxypropyltransferase [Vibrio nitrifigilis]|uniref:tRNA-uridine aminocarboxypropyltransferase n=1 Tax=Vibrio nitrifigilis TaxID=2789781 RepID=A0ABS0GDL4_9VIBR|nr:tRNA-uridine aminocarboxypropyltransferase [Vibrio nitrifigilis]MBF9000511.1 DTW domain-containing protein [Vibrio nitrifigilis]